MFFDNYHYILLNHTSALQHQYLLHYVLLVIYFGHTAGKRRTIFKYYLFIFLSATHAALSASAAITVITPLTSIYASL